jgi:hypothetical protein
LMLVGVMPLWADDLGGLKPWSQLPQIHADLQHPFDVHATTHFSTQRTTNHHSICDPALRNAAPATNDFFPPTMTKYDDYGIPVGAYQEPEGLTNQAWRVVRLRPFAGKGYNAIRRGDWSFRRLLTLSNILVLLWWVVLYWGERGTFNAAIESCNWDKWEDWVSHTHMERPMRSVKTNKED